MHFVLLIVGYPQDFEHVKQTIQEHFEHLQVRWFPILSLDRTGTQKNSPLLKEAQFNVDAVLYLRKEHYLAFSQHITHSVPARYVDIGTEDILQIFLRARLAHQHRLQKISVDLLSASQIQPLLRDPDIFQPNPQVQSVSISTYFDRNIDAVLAEHKQNLENGTDLVLTNIPWVFESLSAMNQPAFLIKPNPDNVIQEIRGLKLRTQIQSTQNRIVLIYLCLRYKDTTISLLPVQFREMEELANVTKAVGLFSHALDGAAFELSRWEYLLLFNEDIFRTSTKNFSNISLMKEISENSVFEAIFSIGIGASIKQAYVSAMTSYGTGVQIRNTNAVITIENETTLDPILYKSSNYESKNNLDDLLSDMAKQCHISYNSLQQLYLAAQRKRSNLFTSSEIAKILNCSSRSANRMLERLLDQNRATISGNALMEKQGRPSRVIRIHF